MSTPTRDLSPGLRLARVIRSAAAGAAALALPVTAIAFSLGGTALAATRPATTATGVTWHKLTLLNGWQSSDGTYHTGDPAWAIKNGVVYLSGSLHQPTVVNSNFAVLPPVARPPHAIYIPVYTFNGTVGFIDIFANGDVDAAGFPPSYAQSYTSLAGISFPVAHAPAHRLTLLHGWKPSIPTDGKPSYSVSGGVVYLSGALRQPVGSNDVVAVLPKAARPAQVIYVSIETYAFSIGVLRVEPDGRLLVSGGPARSFASLGGVSWPVAKLRTHKLALINGWKSGQKRYGTGDPAYSVARGVVYLSGSLIQLRVHSDEFAVLPPAARQAEWAWPGGRRVLVVQFRHLADRPAQAATRP